MTQAAILAASGSPGTTTGFKNRIINGAMVINQRAFSGNATDGGYTLDRWQTFSINTPKYSVAQSSTAPAGFVNSLLVTSLAATSVGSTDYYLLRQSIEGYNIADLGWGTANAKTVTLSFQVYSSLTGTFGGSLQNSAQNRSYPFTYTISSANTWTTISITIAGDTSGTWQTTTSAGIYVQLSLGVGSTYSGTAGSWSGSNYYSATGATSVVATNGATWYITGVQLEVGTTATNFDFRSIGTELSLCQRYFQTFKYKGLGAASGSQSCTFPIALVTEMRATPSASRTSGSITVSDLAVSGYVTTTSTVSVSSASGTTGINLEINNGWSPSLNTLRPLAFSTTGTPSSDATFLLSSEL